MADQFEDYTPDPEGHVICAVQPLGTSLTVLPALPVSAHCLKEVRLKTLREVPPLSGCSPMARTPLCW